MLSNWLRVTKIVVFAYKPIKYLLKMSSANLLKVDGKQIGHSTMAGRIVDGYSGWFFSLCKRVDRSEFPGRQLNEAL